MKQVHSAVGCASRVAYRPVVADVLLPVHVTHPLSELQRCVAHAQQCGHHPRVRAGAATCKGVAERRVPVGFQPGGHPLRPPHAHSVGSGHPQVHSFSIPTKELLHVVAIHAVCAAVAHHHAQRRAGDGHVQRAAALRRVRARLGRVWAALRGAASCRCARPPLDVEHAVGRGAAHRGEDAAARAARVQIVPIAGDGIVEPRIRQANVVAGRVSADKL